MELCSSVVSARLTVPLCKTGGPAVLAMTKGREAAALKGVVAGGL